MGLEFVVEDENAGFDDFGTKYTDHVLFKVVCTGTINHQPLRVCSNKLQAENRAAFKEHLRYRHADAVATEMANKADDLAQRCGNFTAVPRGQVLRQARHEMLKERDTD
ncbi:unnamed protein product, partial [Allacma fusca]